MSAGPVSWPPIDHVEIQHLVEEFQHLPSEKLAAVLMSDQRQRWVHGERIRVEVYLQHLPALHDDAAFVLDLLFNEVTLREERGDPLDSSELVGRFPMFEDQIGQRFSGRQTARVTAKDRGATVDSHIAPEPLDPEKTAAFDRNTPIPVPKGKILVPGYEIQSELGRGGMGVVYKAKHLALDRVVALKMILSGAHAGEEELSRFRNEASAVARVQHPNLVQIFEVGECEGRPYFALEYIDGGSLDKRLREKPMSPVEAARLIETLARAVHAVHRHGLVHRDLKPANILLTAAGEPKITDFGLAKQLNSQHGKTMTGDILGTPMYMAPEQASGRVHDIGPGTDVYALGTILYEALAGRPPFMANSGLDVVMMVTRDEPVPPGKIRGKLPRDLETICLKCLEKQPAKRYASAADLADDLHRFLAGEPILARPIGFAGRAIKWTRRHPAWATMSAVLALGLIAFIVAGFIHNIQLQNANTQLEDALGTAREKSEESRQRLVRLNVASGNRMLEEGDWFGALVYYAEALRLDQGSSRHEEMHRLRIGSVLRQCPDLKQTWIHDRAIRQVSFSPDGQRVLTASDDGTACVWDVESGLQVGKTARQGKPIVSAEFSKDGKCFLTACSDGAACIWDSATGTLRTTFQHGKSLLQAAFNPEGSQVATCGEDGTVLLWDVGTGAQLPNRFTHLGPVNALAFSPDGKWLATASSDKTARLWNVLTGALGPTVTHGDKVLWVAFSPDGKLLITASADDTAQMWDALTGQAHGHPLKHKQAIVHAEFSKDGTRVVTASHDSTARIWDATSGQPISPPLRHTSDINTATFSPNGQWLATGGDDNSMRLWSLANFEEVMPVILHNGSVWNVQFSPDGLLLLSGAKSGTVKLLGLREEQLQSLQERHRRVDKPQMMAPLSRLEVLSRDGTRLLKANDDNSAGLYDTRTGRALVPPLRHSSKVLHVAFNPDETMIVTCSDDNTARLWNANTGRLLTSPLKHMGTVVYAHFSPDGRLVVTTSLDETARVWDAATGESVTPPLIHSSLVCDAEFIGDGLTLKTTDAEGRQLTWKLQRDERPIDEIVNHARRLAECTLDPTRGYLPLDVMQLREMFLRNPGRDDRK
jgi:WD40 repeat protein